MTTSMVCLSFFSSFGAFSRRTASPSMIARV